MAKSEMQKSYENNLYASRQNGAIPLKVVHIKSVAVKHLENWQEIYKIRQMNLRGDWVAFGKRIFASEQKANEQIDRICEMDNRYFKA